MAIHEAGHALVALCSEHADPVAKVTILPAGRSLGVTQQLPMDERHLYSESYLHAIFLPSLHGRPRRRSLWFWAKHLDWRGRRSRRGDRAGEEDGPRLGFLASLGAKSGSEGEHRPTSATSQLRAGATPRGPSWGIDEEVSRLLLEAGRKGAHDPLRTSWLPRRRHRPPPREGDHHRCRIGGCRAPFR